MANPFRLFKATVIIWLLLFGNSAFAQEQRDVRAIGELAPGIMVIKLNYANAEELAATLRQILPPGVTVVAYSPTNSIIISGNPAALEQVIPPGRNTDR